jgi:hypothetical protein
MTGFKYISSSSFFSLLVYNWDWHRYEDAVFKSIAKSSKRGDLELRRLVYAT